MTLDDLLDAFLDLIEDFLTGIATVFEPRQEPTVSAPAFVEITEHGGIEL